MFQNAQRPILKPLAFIEDRNPENRKISLDILVAKTSLEVYVNNGQDYIPHGRQRYYKRPQDEIIIFASGGKVNVNSLQVFELRPIWKSND